MSLTNIGLQETPGRPIEIVFAPNLGLPSDLQQLVIIGHIAATGATASGSLYTAIVINNVSDPIACSGEITPQFGNGSELQRMILAAVAANAGGSTFPTIRAIPLASTDTGYGPSNAALNATLNIHDPDFLVSPYDGGTDSVNRTALSNQALLLSGATRTDNQQFGTFGVMANESISDPASLPATDTQFLILVWLRDLGADGANPYQPAELAAATAAKMASNGIPFNPLDNIVIPSVTAPADMGDWITVGAGLESETALHQGWTPLRVLPNEDVAFVRTITTRITSNGITPTSIYIDVQDFQVLYFWRKTLWTRFTQPDFTNVKASVQKARDVKSEAVRLAQNFQNDQGMFQAVDQLAKQFVVQRNAQDRNRFDLLTPVNVIPGLHVIATQISAGVQFDSFTV